jgi:hypothetical protein
LLDIGPRRRSPLMPRSYFKNSANTTSWVIVYC